MTRNEALELIERLPYIRTIQAPNDRLLEKWLRESLMEENCLEWVKVIKTCYLRQTSNDQKTRPLPPKLAELGEEAAKRFRAAIARALSLPEREVDGFISDYLAESM